MSRSQGLGRLHSQGLGLQFLCRGRRLQDLDLRHWPATSNQRAEPLVLRMGAALPCLRRDRPPRHPPPMARPPPPRLNAPLHRWESGTPPNDWNGPVVVNRPFYDGPPKKAPPPLPWMMPPYLVRDDPWQPPRLRQPPGWAPVKAPPPHLIGNPLLPLRVLGHPPPVKAPPGYHELFV